MIEIGRVCVKITGRDAGKKCIIIEILDDNTVLIDGETRRRKCNVKHLEFLDKKIEIAKGADHKAVIGAFKVELGTEIKEKKPKTIYTKPLKQKILKTRARIQEKKEKPKKEKTETKEKKSAKKKTTKKEEKIKKTEEKKNVKEIKKQEKTEKKEIKEEVKQEPKKA